jgi:hypothetical protein
MGKIWSAGIPGAGIIALVLAAFSGCVGTSGSASFYLMDAPRDDFSSVVIIVTKVAIHIAGAPEDREERNGGSEKESPELSERDVETNESATPDGSWIVLFSGNEQVDLLKFTGGARDFIGTANLSAGKYTQIRISVASAYGILKANGTRVDIKVPSKGLKIVHTWIVEKGRETVLTLDFQLAKSIVKKADGSYALRPVLKLHKEKREKKEAEKDHERERMERRARAK